MRVFRVAHHTITDTAVVGTASFPAGPYCFETDDYGLKDRVRGILRHTQWDAHHPAPFEDRALGTIYGYEVCGFVSESALMDWFAGCLKGLDEAGFRLWVYEVPDTDVRVGSKAGQLVFAASEAKPVLTSRFPLDPQQLPLFEPGDVLSGPGVRDSEAPGQAPMTGQGTSSPDQE